MLFLVFRRHLNVDEVRQNLANFEDSGLLGNLIMARHSSLYLPPLFFSEPHSCLYCFLSFPDSEIWKCPPDASGNKALGLRIICCLSFHLLLASQRLWGLWGWMRIDWRELRETWDGPSIHYHQKPQTIKIEKESQRGLFNALPTFLLGGDLFPFVLSAHVEEELIDRAPCSHCKSNNKD